VSTMCQLQRLSGLTGPSKDQKDSPMAVAIHVNRLSQFAQSVEPVHSVESKSKAVALVVQSEFRHPSTANRRGHCTSSVRH